MRACSVLPSYFNQLLHVSIVNVGGLVPKPWILAFGWNSDISLYGELGGRGPNTPVGLAVYSGNFICSLESARRPFLQRTYASTAVSIIHGDCEADSVDGVVIGAGVIGLAVARAMALRGREVVVVEAAGAIGTETSSRHSEVIHAGIYYPAGTLKTRLCVEGKERLYDFCRKHHVPHKQITKLIVATSRQQLPDLERLRAFAAQHGVPDLQVLGGAEARALEPALSCEGALLSPSTGILDSHTYMEALLADAQNHGAILALNTRVAGGWVEKGIRALVEKAAPTPITTAAATTSISNASGPDTTGSAPSAAFVPVPVLGVASVPYKILELHSLAQHDSGGGGGGNTSSSMSAPPALVMEVSRLRARWVVNAAGLHAVRLAAKITGLSRLSIPRMHLAKGNYFSLTTPSPFNRLVYPLPERGLAGLGTHLTLDMTGCARFGPDVEWLPGPREGTEWNPEAPVEVDYRVDPRRAQLFYPAIRRYYPALPDGALQPAYSGVRPKLSGPEESPADFMVQGACGGHGVRGWVNLFGIESPGLTSSLALAEHVCDLLEKS